MNKVIKKEPIYSHNRSLDNVFGMLLFVFMAGWLFYIHFTKGIEFLFLVFAIPVTGIALYMVDVVVTSVKIYGDQDYLYIKPSQPVSFKKKFKFKRDNIKQTKVETIQTKNNYGVNTVHYVVVTTNDNVKHKVLEARDKKEALIIKKELKEWRYFL